MRICKYSWGSYFNPASRDFGTQSSRWVAGTAEEPGPGWSGRAGSSCNAIAPWSHYRGKDPGWLEPAGWSLYLLGETQAYQRGGRGDVPETGPALLSPAVRRPRPVESRESSRRRAVYRSTSHESPRWVRIRSKREESVRGEKPFLGGRLPGDGRARSDAQTGKPVRVPIAKSSARSAVRPVGVRSGVDTSEGRGQGM